MSDTEAQDPERALTTAEASATEPETLLADLLKTRTLPGENATLFQRLAAQIFETVQPRDVIEEILTHDYVHDMWEAFRYRRYKDNLLRVRAPAGVASFYQARGYHKDPVQQRVDHWEEGDLDELKEDIAAEGLTLEAFMAQTLAMNLDTVERFDDLLEVALKRRAAFERELERHREVAAAQIRNRTREIQDAKFRVVGEKDQANDEDRPLRSDVRA